MLPGGLWEGEARHRDYAFAPVSGHVELALARDASAEVSVPERVSRVLATALASIGGRQATAERVGRLSVADRQFLMRRLAARLGHDAVWLTSECDRCGERFDLFIEQSRLPVQEAAAGYPWVEVKRDDGSCRLRVPDGRDQQAVADTADDREAQWMVIERCFVEGAGAWSSPQRNRRWHEAVETAFDRQAPQVALSAETACPGCGASQAVALDPYLVLQGGGDELFDDVHLLASRYHWSEEAILSLHRERRKLYVGMLDRDRGISS